MKAMLEGKIPMSVENVSSEQSVIKEIEYVIKETDSEESLRLKQEYEDKIAEINVSVNFCLTEKLQISFNFSI